MSIKPILESLLFVNEKPIETSELSAVLEVEKKKIEIALEELALEYQEKKSGMCIVKVAGGYQMCSHPENEPWIKKMYREKNKQKLSSASLETLAIIAYKQPITKLEIESIRGVNADGVSRHLIKLGLIKCAGRKEVVGRPFLYITTRKFLEYFGLNNLKDLPNLEEFSGFDKLKQEGQIIDSQEGDLGGETNEMDAACEPIESQDGVAKEGINLEPAENRDGITKEDINLKSLDDQKDSVVQDIDQAQQS